MTFFSLSRRTSRLEHSLVNANYHAMMSFVAKEYQPGRPVIVALPAAAYLALGDESVDDLSFLAGPEGGPRAEAYSRLIMEGRRIYYWVGMQTIVSANGLHEMLLQHPDALLVLDSYRLTSGGAYGGEIEDVITEMTVPVYQGPGGGLVMALESMPDGPMSQGN